MPGNPAEIIAKMRYLCYNSLKPAACAAARCACPAHADALVRMGFENVETRKTAASGFVEVARLRARCMRSAVCGNRTGGAF